MRIPVVILTVAFQFRFTSIPTMARLESTRIISFVTFNCLSMSVEEVVQLMAILQGLVEPFAVVGSVNLGILTRKYIRIIRLFMESIA